MNDNRRYTSYDILEELDASVPKNEIQNAVAESLGLKDAVRDVREEVDLLAANRDKIIPLLRERMRLTEEMSYLESDFEMEVQLEYPPRKGSEAQRDALRKKLRLESSEYVALNEELQQVESEISDVQFEKETIEQRAKNSRRLLELHGDFLKLIASF